MATWLIGDIHGKLRAYRKLLNSLPLEDNSIQLGDFGFGFDPEIDNSIFPKKNLFIRGNHDSPEICRKQSNYLGDYGITKDGIFYISGAWSIDQHLRQEYISWWRDEELSYSDCCKCLVKYEETKPKIVISHDGPEIITRELIGAKPIKTRTTDLLNQILACNPPELWVFAHHHKDLDVNYGGTHFVCLGELSTYKI